MSGSYSGRLDGGGDALVAAAAADVAAHHAVDVVLRGVLVGRKQRRGLHDLAGLAIAALRDVQDVPSLLDRMIAVRVKPLDCRHRAAADIVYGNDAGAGSFPVDMDRASAAQGRAASVFCSGQTELVPKIPEQRHRRIPVEGLLLVVDAELDH